jgi:hypothetical protein
VRNIGRRATHWGAHSEVMEVYFVLNEHGEPLPIDDVEAWTRWHEQADCGVARTVVSPAISVLTTFKGYDAPEEGKAPLLFVTHIFGGVLDGEEVKHPSRAEALAMHAALVELCQIGDSPDYGITENLIT